MPYPEWYNLPETPDVFLDVLGDAKEMEVRVKLAPLPGRPVWGCGENLGNTPGCSCSHK